MQRLIQGNKKIKHLDQSSDLFLSSNRFLSSPHVNQDDLSYIKQHQLNQQQSLSASGTEKSSGPYDENEVFKITDQYGQQNIYLPGYLRLNLKNFVSIDLPNMGLEISAKILLTVKYGQSSKDPIIDDKGIIQALEKDMVLYFEKDQGIALKQIEDNERNLQISVENDKEAKLIHYSIHRTINAKIYPDVRFSPFELLNSVISISVKAIQFQKKTINFNLMDYRNIWLKMSYEKSQIFGQYCLAPNKMRAIYTSERADIEDFKEYKKATEKQKNLKLKQQKLEANQKQHIEKLKKKAFKTDNELAFIDQYQAEKKQKNTQIGLQIVGVVVSKQKPWFMKSENENEKEKEKEKHKENNEQSQLRPRMKRFKPYKYGNFLIPISKFPQIQLLTIFLPVFILSIINLGIFFQTYDLQTRIASISFLLIAFVALIPPLRRSLPPTTIIVQIEGLIYLQTYKCVVALAQSLLLLSEKYQLMQQWTASGKDIKQFDQKYMLDYNTDELFIISLLITCYVNFRILLLMLFYKLKWEPNYNIKPLLAQQKELFLVKNWGHQQCRKDINHLNMKYSNIKSKPQN